MPKRLLLLLIASIGFNFCKASDTTSVQVLFEFNKSELTNEAKLQLDAIIPDNPDVKLINIKLFGHTDQIGGNDYNYKLSVKRATTVKNYLKIKGINESIISIIEGKGENDLAVDKMDEDSRQQNRRVILLIEYETISKQPAETTKTAPVKKEPTTLIEKIKDTSTKAGNKFVLKNINFEGGRHQFLPQSFPALEELLNAMKSIPTLTIEIQGHICCEIGDVDGMDMELGTRDLSVQRARAVYLYLYRNGIDVSRMTYKGLGHKYPIIAHEETEEERTTNRRVEIIIVTK